MGRTVARMVGLTVLAAAVACESRTPAATQEIAASTGPAQVVDSILPSKEALRRFRDGLVAPDTLAGPRTLRALYEQFADAVRRQDASVLDRLVISRAEFAYLVYPESDLSRPPYRQPPQIAWMLSAAASRAGLAKLLRRADGMDLLGYRCPTEPVRHGALRIWRDCVVRVQTAGGTRDLRLFGAVIERDGRYKFAGLNNGF